MASENKVFRQYVADIGGYNVSSDVATTSDGYLLKVFRIFKTDTNLTKPRPVILLMHGLLDSAEAFVQKGKNSMAINFVNLGYDVWLGNNRGNIYSRGNIYYDILEKEFFDFSFFEIGT